MLTTAHPDFAPFIACILERPNDDEPRLVFADYLEEQGDSDRAEFIRVQCELEVIGREKIGWTFLADGTSVDAESRAVRDEDPRRERLQRRERELLVNGFRDWFAPLFGESSVCRNLYATQTGHEPNQQEIGGVIYDVQRGFVDSISCTLAAFYGETCSRCNAENIWSQTTDQMTHCPACHGTGHIDGIAAKLFSRQPIEVVELSDREPWTSNGMECHWYDESTRNTDHQNIHPESELPKPIYDLLVAGPGSDRRYKRYHTLAAANAALSSALCRFGRMKAKEAAHVEA